MRRTIAIARKEALHLLRDPRSLAAAIAVPIGMLLLYGYAVNYDLKHLTFAVVDQDRTPTSRRIVEAVDAIDGFDCVAQLPSARLAEVAFEREQAMAIVVIPPGLEDDLTQGRSVSIQVLIDGSNSTIAAVGTYYCRSAIETAGFRFAREQLRAVGYRETLLKSSIDVRHRVLYNPDLRTQVFLIPGLIGIILMLMSALLTSGIVVREREHGSFELLAASPVSSREIIIGKLLPYLGLATFDVVLVVGAGWLVFGVEPKGSLGVLLLVSTVYVGCALALGLLFSCVAKTQQLAMMLAFITTVLPTMLLSGFAFPVRNMPFILRWISAVLPATHYIALTRGIVLKGTGLASMPGHFAALVAITLVLVVLAVRRFRKTL